MLRVVGTNAEGKSVVAGAFRFRETHGTPLDVLAEVLLSQEMVISWEHYANEALAAGAKAESVTAAIIACVSDIYGCPNDEATTKTETMMRDLRVGGELASEDK